MVTDSALSTKDYLQQRWDLTIARLQTKPLGTRPFDELFRKYSEETRHYHTIDHLRLGFETLDAVFSPKEPNIVLIDVAFWYHDFICNPKLHDNEAKSAFVAEDRALRILGVSQIGATKITALINETSHKSPPRTRESEILLDIDLAILGSAPEEFDRYEQGIWEECQQHVSLEDFSHARLKVMKKLNRIHVFWTSEMHNSHFERQAKANLRKSIKKLSSKES